MTQLFTIAPSPPCEGEMATLCYSGDRPINVTVRCTPPGSSTVYTIPASSECISFQIPEGAITCNIVDESGASDDLNTPVQEC